MKMDSTATEPRTKRINNPSDSGIEASTNEAGNSELVPDVNVTSNSAREENSYSVVSSLWHRKVREMEEKMLSMENQLKQKDTHIQTLERENRDLKQHLAGSQKVMSDLAKVHDEQAIAKARALLSPKFTINQINLLLGTKARVRWTSEELAQGLSLRYFGAPGHEFVTKTLQYPLPKLSCLQKYTSRMDMRQGFLEDVLNMLKAKSNCMSEKDRACVLLYDEMSCKEIYEYDKKHDDVLGPHSKMQVIFYPFTSISHMLLYRNKLFQYDVR